MLTLRRQCLLWYKITRCDIPRNGVRHRQIGIARFDDKLANFLDNADAVSENVKNSIDKFIAQHQLDIPSEARYMLAWTPPADAPTTFNLEDSRITTVI